jgi:YVTN family beta-propeller protein
MSLSRTHLVISFVALLSLAGYLASPASIQSANARHLVSPSAYLHDLASAQFASEAAHVGSLKKVDTRALLRRFTADSRLRAGTVTGQESGGGVINVNNWTLSPAGTQEPLGDLPVNAVLSPDGRHLLVVNSGAGVQSIEIVNVSDGSVLQTIAYDPPHSVFVGAVYSPDGSRAFVSGGGENVIHAFSVAADGTLSPTGDIAEPTVAAPFNTFSSSSYPTGLSISRDGKTLFVGNSNANNMAIVDLASKTVMAAVPVGFAPYATLVDPSSGLVFVSNWGDATLSVINPASESVVAAIPVGQHPTAMTMGPTGMLYVSDSNSDAVSIVDPQAMTETARVSVTPDPSLPLSSSPQGLSFGKNGRYLYVADAGDNALAVLSLAHNGRSASFEGWIPTAWYPTDVVASTDSDTLFVTNGFGLGEHANNGPLDPDPTRPTPSAPLIQQPTYCNCTLDQFTGTMDGGTLSTIDVPNPGHLRKDTMQVVSNDHFLDASVLDRSTNNPIPLPGQSSPIKHVIYIVKENRTYDQVFGDEAVGKGDPSLTLFPRSVTPNLHALADRFGILDNFYADAQVSADGHNWTLSANANDYAEKLWPQDYSSPGRNFGYPFEGGSSLPLSPGGYLWDAAHAAGVSYRDYGLYANFDMPAQAKLIPESQSDTCTGPITHTYIGVTIPAGQVLCFPPTTANAATTPNLVGHIDPKYLNYDMRYPDLERLAEWKSEFDGFVKNGNLPSLEFLRLSSDHTKGTAPGFWTPQRYVSENDAAVGQLVDIVSHSSYWSSTAIIVVEDDAQNGPDHLDSHRTEALVISPYTARSTPRADSTHYDTAAMVRTIELILGLKPLSQYDATAMPMWRLFGSSPDTTAYNSIPQSVTSGTTMLGKYGATQSEDMNWAIPDQAWAPALNRIVWHAIKGARTPYPGADPYGIPMPSTSHYVWGSLSPRAYPLLRVHGDPKLRVVYGRHLTKH